MTEDEKKEKLIFAVQTGLEEFKTRPIADLIDFVKNITPLKLKNFALSAYQKQADQKRTNGEGQILSADEDDAQIAEFDNVL